MLPFTMEFRSGEPLYEQVVYAVKKAIVSGRLVAGDPFPSVRSLSLELKINPNTAHKVVGHLIDEGLLEVRPGIGTTVWSKTSGSEIEKSALLGRELEQLVVEAKRLSLSLEELLASTEAHWRRLSKSDPEPLADLTPKK